MRLDVYGKEGCGLCKSAHKKLAVFLEKHRMSERVEVKFVDMLTEHGAAEGDFFDVFDVPTVLFMRDDSHVLARWDGIAPPTHDLERLVCPDEVQSAAA